MKNGDVPGREGPPYKVWWKNRSDPSKRLIIIAALVLASLAGLGLVVYLLLPNSPHTCASAACAHAAQQLRHHVDPRTAPCDDFYRFACGLFLRKSNLSARAAAAEDVRVQLRALLEGGPQEPPTSASEEAPASPLSSAKRLYRACANESAVEKGGLGALKGLLAAAGGWPALDGGRWNERGFEWRRAVHALRGEGSHFEFFLAVKVKRDRGNGERYILSLEDPFGDTDGISEEIKKHFLDYMIDMAVLVGVEAKRAKEEQKQVLDFLLNLAKISENARAANASKLYNLYSLSELQTEFPEIAWFEFIGGILHPVQLSYDYEINVRDPLYLKNLLKLLKTTKKRIVANFISWQTLQHLINYLPKNILDRAFLYLKSVDKTATKTSRWNTCVDLVESRLHAVISAAYVKEYLDEETRHRVMSMIRNIKYQFKENLEEVDWLDTKTKDVAREKLVSSVEDVPSYTGLMERSRMYEEVEISEDKLLTSVLNLDYAATNMRYEKLRQPANENFFEKPGSVTGLNVVYSPEQNVLSIPVGLFQGIFYQKKRPEYMNYGALGTVLAHEIYHIITEAKNKRMEKLTSRWTSHSLLNYRKRLDCLAGSYREFIADKIEQHSNGSSTHDEEMADLAGLKTAYDTYQGWVQENGAEPLLPGLNYSPNQLFWIAAAMHHCTPFPDFKNNPERLRVNGALQNLEEFAMDFGCPVGSSMNPRKKCRIW